MYNLENIEWTNVWYEQTAPLDKPRVLLIGDSITQGYRSLVHSRLKGEYYITSHTTSKGLDNPWFWKELEITIHQYEFRYDYVHFNNGLHAMNLEVEGYRKGYEEMVQRLLEAMPDSKLILATTTTECMKNEEGKLVLTAGNSIVVDRNRVVWDLAKKYNLPVDDLYAVVDGKNDLHGDDGIHFRDEGSQALADQVVACLKSL